MDRVRRVLFYSYVTHPHVAGSSLSGPRKHQSHALSHHVDLPRLSPVRSLRLRGSSLADAKSQVSCLAPFCCERLSRYCLHSFGPMSYPVAGSPSALFASLTTTRLGCDGPSCIRTRVDRICDAYTLVLHPFYCTPSGCYHPTLRRLVAIRPVRLDALHAQPCISRKCTSADMSLICQPGCSMRSHCATRSPCFHSILLC